MSRHFPRWAFLATYLAFPVYVVQGIAVRLSSPRLLPPEGPVTGRVDGQGEPIRLLLLGDSSVAGVGADETGQTLAVQTATRLAEATGRPVEWCAAGFNSATTAQLRDHAVPHVEPRDWTHVVISAGTNDMKNFHRLSSFKRDFGTLLYALRARFPDARIWWAPMIDMRKVPALPTPLAWILAVRADRFNAKGEQLCAERGARAIEVLEDITPAGFASDGFHASPAGYATYGRHIAAALVHGAGA